MSSFFDEIAAKLATLSGSATPKQSLEELNEFDVRDIQAVRVSEGGGGGGGNAVIALDLGVLTVAELLATGPKTLYTPTGVAFAWLLFGPDPTDIVGAAQFVFQPFTDTSAIVGGPDVIWQTNGSVAQDQIWASAQNDPAAGFFFCSDIAPLTAYLRMTAAIPVQLPGPLVAWQANHAYSVDDTIDDGNGHFQTVTVAGQSGGSAPSWDDSGGTTDDNEVTWQDNGLLPTDGELHVYALVAIPTAP